MFMVIPSPHDKDMMLERYRQRGNPKPFIDMMEQNYDAFISDCCASHAHGFQVYILNDEQPYLKDAVAKLGV